MRQISTRLAIAAGASLAAAVILGAAAPVEAKASPSWTTLAACAGAYEANARLSDPQRPAAMSAMVSEVASDYLAAATRRHRQETGASSAQSRRAVEAEAKRRREAFAGNPRETAERFIDACPQPDD